MRTIAIPCPVIPCPRAAALASVAFAVRWLGVGLPLTRPSLPVSLTLILFRSCVQRSSGELASYQQKMFRIDDHVGIAIAGLTSDARVLRSVPLTFFLYRCPKLKRELSSIAASVSMQQLYASAGHGVQDGLQPTRSREPPRVRHRRQCVATVSLPPGMLTRLNISF